MTTAVPYLCLVMALEKRQNKSSSNLLNSLKTQFEQLKYRTPLSKMKYSVDITFIHFKKIVPASICF